MTTSFQGVGPASTGDVTGPSSSVDNAIARYNGTGGKTIQDYTSGAPTVSDTGVMTISAGLTISGGGETISGGDLTLTRSNSGGTNLVACINTNTDANSLAIIRSQISASANAGVDAVFQATVDGVGNWNFGVDNSNSDAGVIGPANPGDNDALRITFATPPVVSYNTTHPTGTFDYVCDGCGQHSHEVFACCGAVQWHDDILAVRGAVLDIMTMENPYAPGVSANVAHMVKLGVMEYDTDDDKQALADRKVPWLGVNIKAAQWFTWAGMYQNREKIDELHQRVLALEAELRCR